MSSSVFDIELVDTLKRTIKEVNESIMNDVFYHDSLSRAKKGADSTYEYDVNNGLSMTVTNNNITEVIDSNPVVQKVTIERFADGTQSINVENNNYINFTDDLVLESANDVDVVFSNGDEDDDDIDDSSDDEDDDD